MPCGDKAHHHVHVWARSGPATLCRSGPAQPIPGGPVEQVQLALPSPAPWDYCRCLDHAVTCFFPLPAMCLSNVPIVSTCSCSQCAAESSSSNRVSLITARMRSKGALWFGQFPLCGLCFCFLSLSPLSGRHGTGMQNQLPIRYGTVGFPPAA